MLGCLLQVLALAAVPARATSVYSYGKDEYVTLREGLAPNKQLSLAAHGGDENGNGDPFHVWLMSEPAHLKIAVLPDIGGDKENILDSAADAFRAVWSEESRRVAVLFRSSRQIFEFNLYRIDGRHVDEIIRPDLFKEVTSRDASDGDDERKRIFGVEWRGGNRFVLREFRTFVISDPAFTRLLGKYGRIAEKLDDGKLFVQFAAEADCLVLPGGRTRVIDLRPGDFEKPPIW